MTPDHPQILDHLERANAARMEQDFSEDFDKGMTTIVRGATILAVIAAGFLMAAIFAVIASKALAQTVYDAHYTTSLRN